MATGGVGTSSRDPRAVFVVHGRNETARNQMFAFLRSIGLKPIEWSQAVQMTGKAAPYIGEVLDVAFAAAQAVVVLLTPDDIAYLRPEYGVPEGDPESNPTGQARPNVLFEAGIATGRDSDRTILVQLGEVRPFSDIAGKHLIRLDDSSTKRKELAQRLQTAGCPVDLSGDDWLQKAAFDIPAPPGGGLPLGRRVPSQPGRRVRVDLRYHHRSNGDRLEIINSGLEDLFDLDLELPPEAGGLQIVDRDELPLKRLPSGKSAAVLAFRGMGGGGKDHFDVKVRARTEDGTAIEELCFLSLAG